MTLLAWKRAMICTVYSVVGVEMYKRWSVSNFWKISTLGTMTLLLATDLEPEEAGRPDITMIWKDNPLSSRSLSSRSSGASFMNVIAKWWRPTRVLYFLQILKGLSINIVTESARLVKKSDLSERKTDKIQWGTQSRGPFRKGGTTHGKVIL